MTTMMAVAPSKTISRRRGCIYRLIAVGLGLSLACIVAEAGARIILNSAIRDSRKSPTPGATLFEPDPDLGWRHIPNEELLITEMPDQEPYTVHINARGLYDLDYAYEHPVDGFRMLVLGDSFVDQTHITLHSRSFQIVEDYYQEQEGNAPYQIVEMGVARYSPAHYHRYYRREGRRYHSDVVIVMLYLGNDIDELVPGAGHEIILGIDKQTYYYTLEDGELVAVLSSAWHPPSGSSRVEVWGPPTRQVHDFLNRNSVLYKWTIRSSLGWHTLAALRILDGDMPYGRMFQSGYSDPTYAQTLPILEATLLALRSDVEADGAQFAVVIAPHMYAVHHDWYFEDYPDIPRDWFDAYKLENQVIDILDKHSISHLSLTPALRAAADAGEPMYYRENSHWNLAGNRVIADALKVWFEEAGWAEQE